MAAPRAVLIGGYFGGWVDGTEIDRVLLDRQGLASFGASLGAGSSPFSARPAVRSQRPPEWPTTSPRRRRTVWAVRQRPGRGGRHDRPDPGRDGPSRVVSGSWAVVLGAAGTRSLRASGRRGAIRLELVTGLRPRVRGPRTTGTLQAVPRSSGAPDDDAGPAGRMRRESTAAPKLEPAAAPALFAALGVTAGGGAATHELAATTTRARSPNTAARLRPPPRRLRNASPRSRRPPRLLPAATQRVVTPFVPAMTWRGRAAVWIARTPT